MSYEENLQNISYDADASVGIYTGVPGQPGSAVPNGGKQYHAVKLTGKNQIGLAVTGNKVFGVLQNKPQTPGAAATVGYEGVTNVISGAAIVVGDNLVADATGRLIPGTEVAGSKRLVAVAPAAGAGELIPAQFI